MTPDLRELFERLLRDLPGWEQAENRRPMLRSILEKRPIWHFLDLEGSPAIAADALIDTCDGKDAPSLCVLLGDLREKYMTHPARLREIDLLVSHLCSGQTRPRGKWELEDGPPYLGLIHFDRKHAPLFFGQEEVLAELAKTLNTEQGQRFTVVWGASGSGKSSLVRAGLWARLAKGDISEMEGSRKWLISDMKPGNDPMDALRTSALSAVQDHESFRGHCDWRREFSRLKDAAIAARAERLLLQAPEGARWLVILDQMEELFAEDTKEKGAAFLDQLIEATEPPSPVRVVATMRADLFHHCLNHPRMLSQLGRDGFQFPLGQAGRRSLEQMVSGPLTRVELVPAQPWYLDPDLPATIATDAERRPGGLALMAFALRELYIRCESTHRMDVAAYRDPEFGGLEGATRRKAEATVELLREEGKKALESVFAQLVKVDPEGAVTRRRERLSVWRDNAGALDAIQRFQDARLLVADRGAGGEPVIEVAHEALLREWPRLARWIEEHREALQIEERVKIEAHLWTEGDATGHQRRPWPADMIEDYRQKLERAGLLDSALEDPDVARLLTPEVEWIQGELAWKETTNLRRWEIGRRLAEIGDPRAGVSVIGGVPDILWRPITGGTVEIERHGKFQVTPFRMASFPVTFAQFRAFANARDDYKDGRWWRGLMRADPDPAWESPLGNHPVTYISWFDATAFCRWLSAQVGLDVRLPDEWEWQWAAQNGQNEHKYPWGEEWLDGCANTSESDIQHTTAVGMFPHGDSLRRVSDLAGNVWEWCRNEYGNPRETGADRDKSRVLRGGSWFDYQDTARAVSRNFYYPVNRNYYIGFRVVV